MSDEMNIVPVSGHIDLGDLEVEVNQPYHGDTVTSCGEVEQLLLQLQGEGQYHVPEMAKHIHKQVVSINNSRQAM